MNLDYNSSMYAAGCLPDTSGRLDESADTFVSSPDNLEYRKLFKISQFTVITQISTYGYQVFNINVQLAVQ